MSSESKQVPRTNTTREAALDSALAKHVAMGGSSYLTTDTATLLIAIQGTYKTARAAINVFKALFFNFTHKKAKARTELEMVCSHFIQVFAFGVKRGVFSVGDFAYYGLTENGNLPDMRTDAKLLEVAKNLVTGDIERMAVAGAVAMAMPTADEVKTARDDYDEARTKQNNADEDLKTAETTCNALNTGVDTTLKTVYAEIETKCINDSRPTMRDKCRLWGIIFSRTGSPKIITGTVKDSVTGEIINGVIIYFANGNNEAESDITGYKLDTTLMGTEVLTAEHPLYTTLLTEVTLVENENQVVDLVLVRIV